MVILGTVDELFYDNKYVWVECDLDTEYRMEYNRLFVRGTDSIENHLTNLDLWGHEYYHDGFYRMALAIENSPDFAQILKEFNITQVIGHSSGGAIAGILGQRFDLVSLALNTPKFCKRRVPKHILKYFHENCIIANQKYDLVSYLPLGYRHPTKVHYSKYFSFNPCAIHSKIDIIV